MKSYTSESPAPPVKPYPKLMCSKDGLVVLFQDEKTGTVLVGNLVTRIGDHFDCWDFTKFQDFHYSVTISSED